MTELGTTVQARQKLESQQQENQGVQKVRQEVSRLINLSQKG